MSLRINKDNIFFILPEDRYSVSKKIDKYMSEDFTFYVKVKINHREMENDKEYFIFARNGMHSGISVYKDNDSFLHIVYSWWIIDEAGENQYKSVSQKIEKENNDDFHEVVMICDDVQKEIYCYLNSESVDTISYKKCERHKYENTFYWFGCGSMMCPEEHRHIGDFNFELSFLLNKKIDIVRVDYIVENYKELYTVEMFDNLRKLKDNFYLKDNFAFFCDFNNSTKYKIWDMTFSGNYPQIYIENNIYF
jgi:hypothetical protein